MPTGKGVYTQKESILSKAIIEAIEERYELACLIKIQPGRFMSRGCPDIIGVVEGRMVAIEVKMPGKENTLTDDQVKWLTGFGDAGAVAGMVTSVEDAILLLEDRLYG